MSALLSGLKRFTKRITACMGYGKYGTPCGAQAIIIGRDHTARLMRLAGVTGKGKGGAPVTTGKSRTPDTREDLVKRDFRAMAPNRLWVADITYVRTERGFVYAAFVTDCYSRRIVGWALSDTMRTQALPLQALNLAIARAREMTNLVHHSDYGSQYVSIVYNERLAEYGITPSTGSVGDSYDKALAENVNGSYKNELIHRRVWYGVLEVEIATFEWVTWWNEGCLYEALG
ncbi:IS3 family transposase [Rothia nasisuis]|nr:IS3 family transposase [Rothia nasisuis]